MTRTRIAALAAVVLGIVAVVALILDGLIAAYFPAALALTYALGIFLVMQYAPPPKPTAQRIATTAVVVLVGGLAVGSGLLIVLKHSDSWTQDVTTVVVLATGVAMFIQKRPRSIEPPSA